MHPRLTITTRLLKSNPFGSDVNTRGYSAGKYRFGFNGQEKAAETVSDAYDFGARIYDARLGRWLAVDAYKHAYPQLSPYTFAMNDVIRLLDEDGNFVRDKEGNLIFTTRGKSRTTEITQPGSQTAYFNEIYEKDLMGDNNVVYREHFELRYEAVNGYLLDNSGKKVPALLVDNARVRAVKVIEVFNKATNTWETSTVEASDKEAQEFTSTLDARTNCTGSALLDGKFVVFSNAITNKVKQHEHFRTLGKDEIPMPGDIGIYKAADGTVEHFVTYVSQNQVNSKGGVAPMKENVDPLSKETWDGHASYEVWRKVREDCVVDAHMLGTCDRPGIHVVNRKESSQIKREVKRQQKQGAKD